jgi:rare lipoprotein A
MIRLFVALLSLLILSSIVFASEEADASKPSFSGHAHWYGKELHGNRTASGAVFDKDKLTAAHPNLKFGTKVRVISKVTKKEVVVEITDRCPVRSSRVIDLSEAAAKEIGIWPGNKNDVDCYIVAGKKKD